MISAQIRDDEVWCGRPGCGRRSRLGRWARIETGTEMLILSERWSWDTSVERPRWRWSRRLAPRGRSELRAKYGSETYAQNWPAGVIRVTDPQGRQWITITLPTVIECPGKCQAVQRVEAPTALATKGYSLNN